MHLVKGGCFINKKTCFHIYAIQETTHTHTQRKKDKRNQQMELKELKKSDSNPKE